MLSVLKKEMVMDNSHRLVLSDVPFNAGEKVIIFVTTENALQNKLAKWQALFDETQALPQFAEITEAEVRAEIKTEQTVLQKIINDFYSLPISEMETFDTSSVYQGKTLSLDDMEQAIEYEAGLQQ